MSLDHVNIVANLLYIMTSLRRGVSLFDFLYIFVDLLNLVYFQNIALDIYRKYKGRQTRDIENAMHQQLALSLFFMQNGSSITTPLSFIMNTTEMGRMGLMVAFRFSPVVFGPLFIVYNLAIIGYLVKKWIVDIGKYSKLAFKLFLVSLILESIVFTLLGCYALRSENTSGESFYVSIMIVFLLIYIFSSITATIGSVILPVHTNLYLKHLPASINNG